MFEYSNQNDSKTRQRCTFQYFVLLYFDQFFFFSCFKHLKQSSYFKYIFIFCRISSTKCNSFCPRSTCSLREAKNIFTTNTAMAAPQRKRSLWKCCTQKENNGSTSPQEKYSPLPSHYVTISLLLLCAIPASYYFYTLYIGLFLIQLFLINY